MLVQTEWQNQARLSYAEVQPSIANGESLLRDSRRKFVFECPETTVSSLFAKIQNNSQTTKYLLHFFSSFSWNIICRKITLPYREIRHGYSAISVGYGGASARVITSTFRTKLWKSQKKTLSLSQTRCYGCSRHSHGAEVLCHDFRLGASVESSILTAIECVETYTESISEVRCRASRRIQERDSPESDEPLSGAFFDR